jgi:hypothetical protein
MKFRWKALDKRGEVKKMMTKQVLSSMALLATCGCFGGIGEVIAAPNQQSEIKDSELAAKMESAFYCNVQALNPAERSRHNQLTEKLLATRKATVETEKGYELQFNPADVTLAEVAEWVVAEGKCCPFLDFHIDLERSGKLICLRLTGRDGVKQFLRAEFGLKQADLRRE